MIDVSAVLRQIPEFKTFCSVQQLIGLVDKLREDSAFHIAELGRSAGGRPVHHVRFGAGTVKALFVGFPHPNEPIGGLTVFSLLTLLAARDPMLAGADVEWHVVPCIDPDGTELNEGWSQHPFDLERYMRNFHRQAARDQVDCSFPIHHKRLVFSNPVRETRMQMELFARVRPHFYYSLHNNAGATGVWLLLSRDIGATYHEQLRGLLQRFGMPIQVSAPFGGLLQKYSEGIYENVITTKLYDHLEKTTPAPEEVLERGGMSFDYMAEVSPHVLSFVSELPYVRHPSSGSKRPTGENLRRLKLELDAENKLLATLILEEFAKVEGDLARDNQLFTKVISSFVSVKERLPEGLPCWPAKTRDLLFNPLYAREATEGERFDAYMLDRFFVLCHGYEFVRLLRISRQSPTAVSAISRLEQEFTKALKKLDAAVSFAAFEPFVLSDLARVQLGSGLIVLNSLLERKGATQQEFPGPGLAPRAAY